MNFKMTIYRIVKCPNCAFFQVTGSQSSLKCQKCGKSKVISYLKIYYKTNNNSEAAKVLAKLKEEEAKQKGKYLEDFESVL